MVQILLGSQAEVSGIAITAHTSYNAMVVLSAQNETVISHFLKHSPNKKFELVDLLAQVFRLSHDVPKTERFVCSAFETRLSYVCKVIGSLVAAHQEIALYLLRNDALVRRLLEWLDLPCVVDLVILALGMPDPNVMLVNSSFEIDLHQARLSQVEPAPADSAGSQIQLHESQRELVREMFRTVPSEHHIAHSESAIFKSLSRLFRELREHVEDFVSANFGILVAFLQKLARLVGAQASQFWGLFGSIEGTLTSQPVPDGDFVPHPPNRPGSAIANRQRTDSPG